MSSAATRRPVVPVVASGTARRFAVERWLLQAADDIDQARQEWHRESVALLRCGGPFGAIRINAAIVWGAAGTDDLPAVDRYLAKALLGGPVFTDQESGRYYALVGAGTGRRNDWKRPGDDAEFMGRDHYFGVPALTSVEPSQRFYWCVEMDGPGVLAGDDAVSQLVHTGRSRLLNEQSGR